MSTQRVVLRICGALCLAAAVPLSAQNIPRRAGPESQKWQAPRTADGQVDIQGYWRQTNNVTTYSLEQGEAHRAVHIKITGQRAATGKPIVDPPDGRIPYLPWAEEKFNYLVSVHEGPERVVDLDPVARGFMEGVPRINLQTGFQILQMPNQVVFLYEYGHHYRVIPLDGRPHLDPAIKLWMGDSRAHWEGNTLVVDVTNQNDQTWFDQVGAFHGPDLHVTERWTFTSVDQLDFEATLTEPKVFSRPWVIAMNYSREKEEGYEQYEHAVWEGNKSVELMVRPKAGSDGSKQ